MRHPIAKLARRASIRAISCFLSRNLEWKVAAIELDRTDLRILDMLQEQGRLSNQDIAERVSLSPSPCIRRIKRLFSTPHGS
jgi:DNA-binding MarR family transcriptional regulator